MWSLKDVLARLALFTLLDSIMVSCEVSWKTNLMLWIIFVGYLVLNYPKIDD